MRLKYITMYCISNVMCFLLHTSSAAQSTYFDISLGKVRQANKNIVTETLKSLPNRSNKTKLINFNYTWTLGGDLGYQINHYFGIEGGGFVFQNEKMYTKNNMPSSGDIMKSGDKVEFKSWLAYLAMKARTPILKMIDMYAKVGAGYQAQSTNGTTGANASNSINHLINNFWTPVLSMGIENHISKSLHLRLQYMYVPSNWLNNSPSTNNISTNPKNIYTLSLGYSFSL